MKNVRRTGVAALLAATLAVSVAACGGDEGGTQEKGPSSSAASPGADKAKNGSGGATSETETVLATVKGDAGVEMVINSATRDSGGFLTLNGQIKNTGSEAYTTPVQWSGTEEAVAATDRSFAGMTLVDSKAKKRYYVLRDTDNRPLTTSGFDPSISGGSALTFFAQFPAPEASTHELGVQFPGFPNATIEISG
ncbi:hypothetical protein [Streptomyces sp. NBC_00525]|uniref:hypothetical protein n=1 Tax=Streptomyces sp. NBC_00525 TaxID=2903660 RepID=UPI002E81B0ED|nr:hypothetical protein [Streptomyces sp. NBC_00525]WUC95675.1 hypothetical protein OG710_19660 [Streptomyces sp. NBC_00525]